MSSDGTVSGNEFPTYSAGTKFDSNSLLEICPGGADYQLRCRIKDLNLIYNMLNLNRARPHLDIHRNIINKVKRNSIISHPHWKLSAFRR